jgi:hypothetical protein
MDGQTEYEEGANKIKCFLKLSSCPFHVALKFADENGGGSGSTH